MTRAPLRRGPRVLAALALVALAGCGGSDEEPASGTTAAEGDVIANVEGVDGGEITETDLEVQLQADAEALGDTPPATGSPEFDLQAGNALDQLILQRWIIGDAAEQGGTLTEEDAAALAQRIQPSGVEKLRAGWGPRTECETSVVSRLCGGGETEPPPDIPPASG